MAHMNSQNESMPATEAVPATPAAPAAPAVPAVPAPAAPATQATPSVPAAPTASAIPAPPAAPATPIKAAASLKPTTPKSQTNRMQCSDDPKDFNLVKIHTAKCSVCDKRNATDEMRRCKGCTWQICRPCQITREQKGRTLAHGNLMTATPGSSMARGMSKVPAKSPTPRKDPEAEAALEKVKEEDRKEEAAKESAVKEPAAKESAKSKKKSAVQTQDVMTPPSSGERKNLGRRSKVHTNYAEPEDDFEEDDSPVRKAQTSVGSSGSGKRKMASSSSPANEQSPTGKRSRKYYSLDTSSLPPLRPRLKTSEQESNMNLDDSEEAKHSRNMNKMFGNFKEGRDILAPNLYNYMPNSQSGYATIPVQTQPAPIVRDGVPRMSGEELMETKVRPLVRRNLAARFGWRFQKLAIQPPTGPSGLTAPTSSSDTLRDLADNEARTLHHNLALDDDQEAELLSAMRHAARKFGNDLFSKMATGFKAVAKPGLDMALVHLNDSERLGAVAAVQKQAAYKLQEFEEEIRRLAGPMRGSAQC